MNSRSQSLNLGFTFMSRSWKGKKKGDHRAQSSLSHKLVIYQSFTAYWFLHEWVFAQKKPPKNNKTNNKNNLVLQHEDAHALNKLCSLFSDFGSDDLYSDSEEDEASNFEPVRWGFLFNMSCQLHVSLVLCGALHTLLPMSSRGVLRDKSSRNIKIKPRDL